MKRIFILYTINDEGKTLKIHENLELIYIYVKRKLGVEISTELFETLWINQYEVDEETQSVKFDEVFDTFDRGELPTDLHFF